MEEDEELEKAPESKVWKVVKHCRLKNKETPGHVLRQGDLIRIGRVRFKIREIESPLYSKLRD